MKRQTLNTGNVKFKIALAQTDSSLGNIERNVRKHIASCKKAINNKADLIVFPELSLTGYSLEDMNFEVALNPYTSEALEPLRKISKKISIICGGVEEEETHAVFNAAFYIDDGKVKFTHKKIFPPDYGMF